MHSVLALLVFAAFVVAAPAGTAVVAAVALLVFAALVVAAPAGTAVVAAATQPGLFVAPALDSP